LELVEMIDRVPLTDAEIAKWRRDNESRFRYRFDDKEPQPPKTKPQANGRLRIQLSGGYHGHGNSTWSEGPRAGALGTQLPSVLRELEDRAAEDAARAERRRLEEVERERERERALHRQRLAEIEQARAERLFNGAALWRRVEDARSYIAALRTRLDDLDPSERERIERWIEWAEAYLRASDPVENTKLIQGVEFDELLP
jgi:hypothetical protein